MIPMKKASLINGWLFLATIFSGLASLLYPVAHFFGTETAAWDQFRKGELVRKLEKHVDEVFVLREPSISLWADASFLFFHAGRPGVLVGEDDWLFTREEYYYDSLSEQRLTRNLNELALTVCALEQLGKQVLMVPVPAKRRLYVQRSNRAVSPGMDSLYQRITSYLGESGITWLDDSVVNAACRCRGCCLHAHGYSLEPARGRGSGRRGGLKAVAAAGASLPDPGSRRGGL
jgi:alginate O-acetyltransferase complex protein AlgJ